LDGILKKVHGKILLQPGFPEPLRFNSNTCYKDIRRNLSKYLNIEFGRDTI